MPLKATSYLAECGTTLHEGDRAYDYYSMKPGRIGKQAGSSGEWAKWFDFIHDDGTITTLNGERICSLAFAARREFPGAMEALTKATVAA